MASDIEDQVSRVLKGLGNPEPPLDLRFVRDLLSLDRGYYSIKDPSLLQDAVSKLKIAGKQILRRPTLLIDVVKKRNITALFIPDQKRILLDKDVPQLKHRWNEAHEIGHSIIEWHAGAMFGDDSYTLLPSCHEKLEAEANYAAARLLFMNERFGVEAIEYAPTIASVIKIKPTFGNTYTTTFWRCVEIWGKEKPVVGLITKHPHPSRRDEDFDSNNPCKYFIQSDAFKHQFSTVLETTLFDEIVEYCSSRKGGPLGSAEVLLMDDNGDGHVFLFETFSFTHNILTLGLYLGPKKTVIAF